MTTTGYGDLSPDRNNPIDIIAAMLLMLSGITLTSLFIAFGTSLLTRVHWVTMQGLRPVHRRGHIIVCGAGSIGSDAIDLLLALGKRLVAWSWSRFRSIRALSNKRASSALIS
jgi:hypothetical protein